jgi:hypothetical protein
VSSPLTPRRARRALLGALAAVVLLAGCGGEERADTVPGDAAADTAAFGPSETAPADFADMTLAEQAWSVGPADTGIPGRQVFYAVVLTNPNDGAYGTFPTVQVTARGKDGAILGTDEQVLDALPPNGRIAFGGQIDATRAPATVQITAKKVEWAPTDIAPEKFRPFGTTNLHVTKDTWGETTITGEVTNPYPAPVSDLAVTALFRDKTGKLVGGTTSFVSTLPAAGSLPFELHGWRGLPKFARVEAVAATWGGPDSWQALAEGAP